MLGYLKEPSHGNGSFEYFYNICCGREMRKLSFSYALLTRGLLEKRVFFVSLIVFVSSQ